MMMTMTDQEKIAIASAKIVYVLAVSGCGKSFTGDYLGVMHGFHHVDGGKLYTHNIVISFSRSFSRYHHYNVTVIRSLSNNKSYNISFFFSFV
jgi:ABC-type nitrate/sulfonate/bicarbonate transport system ATPase subunit